MIASLFERDETESRKIIASSVVYRIEIKINGQKESWTIFKLESIACFCHSVKLKLLYMISFFDFPSLNLFKFTSCGRSTHFS